MKTVLIPVDFSEGSMNSCTYALDFLGKDEAVIYLFHIYNDQVLIPDSGFTGGGMDTDTFFNSDMILAMKEQSEKEMDGLETKLKGLIKKKKCNVQLMHTLLGGDPRWEIAETIQELHPDLVIMATQGNGKKGFLEGRMAEKIMNKSTVPVLAVPSDFNEFHIRNLIYTTSFNPMEVDALKLIFKILETRKISIHVCHFLKEKERENASAMMEYLQKEFHRQSEEGKIDFHLIETENEGEALKDFAVDHQIDLVTFLPGKKHLLKDLFSSHQLHKKDLFRLELPLLAVHI